MTRVALITGITGQDGSYLAELLLEKDYYVWGLIRRSSHINTQRIDHLYVNQKLILRYGDLSDSANLLHIMYEIKSTYPDLERIEVYNLGAMSHVKVSFELPEYTGNVDGLGVLRLLEAIRSAGLQDMTRFYQASTSELYGKVVEVPQKETTPFYPRSPYGVAKLYGFWITKNYRESYDMFCSNGILFNHETLAGFMPLIFKDGDEIDIKPISEIVKYHTLNKGILVDETQKQYQQGFVEKDLYVWDNNDWTKVKFASGYPHDIENDNKKPRFIISKNSAYVTTSEHEIIMEDDSEKKTKDIEIGDKVKLINYPKIEVKHLNEKTYDYNEDFCTICDKQLKKKYTSPKHFERCLNKKKLMYKEISQEEAEFLGIMVGNRNVHKKCIRYISKDESNIEYVKNLWTKICKDNDKKPGFKDSVIDQLSMTGFREFFEKYKIYNEDKKTKRIPKQVLNSGRDMKLKFLEGYNRSNESKLNKCGNLFKNFKTNSATLAQGLLYLIKDTTDQEYNINVDFLMKNNKRRIYYSLNLLSDSVYSISKKNKEKEELVLKLYEEGLSQRRISEEAKISRKFISNILYGKEISYKNLSIENNKVKKIIDYEDYNGWFYDLETESGKFAAGIGQGRIHNSPRRGETFVTRKITRGLGMILRGEREKLVMGNLDSLRDWGHARDFVEGMWLILQKDKPDDYVLSTNEYHSVREFIELAFSMRGFDIKWKGEGINEIGYDSKTGRELIFVSEKYFRPAEVEQLLGDSTKARNELEWTPKTSFIDLVREMVESDAPVI